MAARASPTRPLPRRSARGAAKINISTNLKHVWVESFVNYHLAKPTDFEPLRVGDAQYQACKAMFHGFIEKFGGKDRGTALPQCAVQGGLRDVQVLKAIIFDCDGVLVDTERDGHRVGFNRAFKALGIDAEWSVELYAKLLLTAGGKERMRAYFDEYGWPAGTETDEAKDALILALHKTKTQITSDLVSEGGLPIRPGILRNIDEAIATGVKLACAPRPIRSSSMPCSI